MFHLGGKIWIVRPPVELIPHASSIRNERWRIAGTPPTNDDRNIAAGDLPGRCDELAH